MLDTGISANGDLAGRVGASADLSGEWNFTDSYGHGTFMAGLIAGSGQGGGPARVAPGADLIDLKVAGADGATTLGQVLAAMQLADAARDRFNLRVLNVPSRTWWRRASAWSGCGLPAPPSTWPTRRPGSATATSAGRGPRCRRRGWLGRPPGCWPPIPDGARTG